MRKIIVYAAALLLMGTGSCHDREAYPTGELSGESQADPAFDWSTTTVVDIEVMALELPVEITRKLVLSTEDGTVFYAGSQKMNEYFTLSVELPNHSKSVTMVYGTIEKTLELTGPTLVFDYLQ